MFLDHTGHFIPDAEAARAALVDLGFTVTPYSAQVQPDPKTGVPGLTGTGNICVMLPEGYLEFLVYTADTLIGREFMAALDRRAGLHLAAFAVPDAEARHRQLQAGGHPMRPLVRFSRDVATEAGAVTARFTVARLVAGTMPEGRVQVLTHATPEAMWQPRWTAHDNGAQRLEAIVISAPSPQETADRFAGFLGVPATAQGGGQSIALTRGAVDILPEAEVTRLTGQPVAPGHSVFAALRIGVPDLSVLEGRTGSTAADGRLVVPFHPALGLGAWIFEKL